MKPEKTVKVKFLRTLDTGAAYYAKGTEAQLPEAEAKTLAQGKRPTVEILKGSA